MHSFPLIFFIVYTLKKIKGKECKQQLRTMT